MGEIKSRSIRLDDENWEWLSKLPGRTSNEALLNHRVWVTSLEDVSRGAEGQLVDVRPVLEEILELQRGAPETMKRAVVEGIQEWKGRTSTTNFTPSTTSFNPPQGDVGVAEPEVTDPRTIAGVTQGPPKKVEGGFPCRCQHSGCQGAKFSGRTKFQSRCDECEEKGAF